MDLTIEDQGQNNSTVDTGLACFVVAMAHMGTPVKEADLREKIGDQLAELPILMQLARQYSYKAVCIRKTIAELKEVEIPAIARLLDGAYVMVGWNDDKNVFLADPLRSAPYAQPLAEFAERWSGELLVFTSGFDWRRMVKKYNLEWFFSVIKRYKPYWRDVFFASFFFQFFGLLAPLFTQVIIDKVLSNNGVSTLNILGIALITLSLFQCGMGILRTYLLTHTTNKLDVVFGARLFRHLVTLPLPYFEHRRVGDTMMRIGTLSGIREFLTGTALTVVLDVLFSVVFLGVMLWFSPTLTLLSMAIIPAYIFMNLVVTPAYKKRLEAVWATGAENNAFLVETVTGIQTVKALAVEPQFISRWESLLAQNVSKGFDSARLGIGINSVTGVLQLISSLSIFWLGGHMVMERSMTLGQLIAFQMLAAQANGPLLTLVGMWQSFQQTALSVERLGDILNNRPERILAPYRQDAPPLGGRVEFEKVVFRYRLDFPPVLSEVSFIATPGLKLGIVGRSGSGKSTMTKLIQNLYQPESGRVLIDGLSVLEVPPTWLRSQIGVVLQENFLYNASVRDNIALAHPGAMMEEVVRASVIAGAHEFILELPEGYDTKVGERGASLSGGQRQRIAIARALLANPRILIFDEATSALDYESERIIMENMDEISAGRTLFVVAHRLSTVKHCDVIMVLDKGRLVEQGSHAELMAIEGGLYRYLYEQQEE